MTAVHVLFCTWAHRLVLASMHQNKSMLLTAIDGSFIDRNSGLTVKFLLDFKLINL